MGSQESKASLQGNTEDQRQKFKGPDETALMSRQIWAFTVLICHKGLFHRSYLKVHFIVQNSPLIRQSPLLLYSSYFTYHSSYFKSQTSYLIVSKYSSYIGLQNLCLLIQSYDSCFTIHRSFFTGNILDFRICNSYFTLHSP